MSAGTKQQEKDSGKLYHTLVLKLKNGHCVRCGGNVMIILEQVLDTRFRTRFRHTLRIMHGTYIHELGVALTWETGDGKRGVKKTNVAE